MPAKTVSGDDLKKAAITGSGSPSLPIKRDLTVAYLLSLVIVLLMALAAVTGLLSPTTIYPTDELILAFVPVDLFHLVVGVPVLLGSMWLARRGKLIGLLCWPGALLYVLYSYVLNLIGVPFGVLFLPYLLLVTLSAYTAIALVASIDGEAVRLRLTGVVPVRAAGVILIVLTSLFILNAVAEIVIALANQSPVGPLDLMLWIADLSILGPACLVGGILLLQRKALGYTSGTGLLLVYSMLFIGLVPVLAFPAFYSAEPIDVVGLVMMLAAGLVSLILFALFARGAMSDRGPSPA